jgi:predicted AlkP superfamily pyrophosphatase or phosphodiesterase
MSFRAGPLALLLILCPCFHAQPGPPLEVDPVPARARHVIIISVDGLRPDAIAAAGAARLMELIRRGAHAAKATTIDASCTLPSHTSMLTGLLQNRHGVLHNYYTPGAVTCRTVFTAAKASGRSCAMFISKEKLRYLAVPGSIDHLYGPDAVAPDPTRTFSAREIALEFREQWSRSPFGVAFVHFREPDAAGHAWGWMTEEYLAAVRIVDEAIGAIADAVSLKTTAIIVSADHGGHGQGHGTASMEDLAIPWICVGPGVPPGMRIDREISTCDTAATALQFLGLAPRNIDGRPVVELFD